MPIDTVMAGSPISSYSPTGVAAIVWQRRSAISVACFGLVYGNRIRNSSLKTHLAAQGATLPGYVEQEFEDYLKCGRLEHGFLRVRCDTCHAEHIVVFNCKRRLSVGKRQLMPVRDDQM